MAKAKKTLSLVMAVLMMAFTFLTYLPTTAKAAETLPTVKFVGLQNIPAAVGEEQTLFLTSNYTGDVQYQVFYLQRNDPTKKATEGWTKLGDWTTAANAQIPVEVKVPAGTITVADNYSFAVRVKRAGVTGAYSNAYGDYDHAYAFNYRFAATATEGLKAAKVEKAEVAVGDKFVVSGLVAGNTYRLFTLNEARAARWDAAPVATSTTDKLEWAPTAAGNYVLDVQLMGADGKVAAVKLFNVKVVDALKVTKVSSVNKKEVKVTFNKDVTDVKASNFEISEKDDQYSLTAIDSVDVDKNVVVLSLIDELDSDTDYVLTAKNVKAVAGSSLESSQTDFNFVEVTDAASIAFVKTTVSASTASDTKTLKVVIKDKDGNDITANIVDLEDSDDITDKLEVETSDSSVVNEELAVGTLNADGDSEKAIVNVKIADTDVETGNTIITVQNSLTKLASIGRATLVDGSDTPDYKSPTTSLYESDKTMKLVFEALDADSDVIDDGTVVDGDELTKSFRSLNNAVLVVDASTGVIKPVGTGTATVVMTAELGDNKFNKTISIEVKGDREATSLKLDKTSVTLVRNANFSTTVTANVLDQYGKVISDPEGTMTYKINYANVVEGLDKDDEQTATNKVEDGDTTGDYEMSLEPYQNADADAKTAKITVTYEEKDDDNTVTASFKGYITVKLVKEADFAGYAVVADDTTLDMIDQDAATVPGHDSNEDLAQGPTTTTISVYEKDTNGNYISKLVEGDFETSVATASKHYVSVDGEEITGIKVGSEAVIVKVGTSQVGKVTFKVVDSTPVVDTLSQENTVITLNADATDFDSDVLKALFGEDEDGAAFVGYSQYDKAIYVTGSDVDVVSSDDSVVRVTTDADGNVTSATAVGDGTATLTIVADKVYTITVNVKNLED